MCDNLALLKCKDHLKVIFIYRWIGAAITYLWLVGVIYFTWTGQSKIKSLYMPAAKHWIRCIKKGSFISMIYRKWNTRRLHQDDKLKKIIKRNQSTKYQLTKCHLNTLMIKKWVMKIPCENDCQKHYIHHMPNL